MRKKFWGYNNKEESTKVNLKDMLCITCFLGGLAILLGVNPLIALGVFLVAISIMIEYA